MDGRHEVLNRAMRHFDQRAAALQREGQPPFVFVDQNAAAVWQKLQVDVTQKWKPKTFESMAAYVEFRVLADSASLRRFNDWCSGRDLMKGRFLNLEDIQNCIQCNTPFPPMCPGTLVICRDCDGDIEPRLCCNSCIEAASPRECTKRTMELGTALVAALKNESLNVPHIQRSISWKNALQSISDHRPKLRSVSFAFSPRQQVEMDDRRCELPPISWESTLISCSRAKLQRILCLSMLPTDLQAMAFLSVQVVAEGSPCFQQGLRAGDLILKYHDFSRETFLAQSATLLDVAKRSTRACEQFDCILLRRGECSEGKLYRMKLQPMEWEHGAVLGCYLNTYPLPSPADDGSASATEAAELFGVVP